MSDDRDSLIRARAYELWKHAGCPDGQALEHWLDAERELFSDDSHVDDTSSNATNADVAREEGAADAS